MRLLTGCFNVPTIIVKVIIICFILAVYFNEGLSHVGEKCKFFLFCMTKNSYCDAAGICRCKPEYPVNVTPHDCRRGRHHGNKCQFSEECRYYDSNSYCTQTPYRSVCDCHPELVYDEKKKLCSEVPPWKSDSQGVLLPTILGISLGIASMLCCCLAAWHCCQRHRSGEGTGLFRNFTLRRSRNNANGSSGRSTQIPSNDTLPPYEMIMRENNNQLVDELPPSYEDVIKQAKCEVKT